MKLATYFHGTEERTTRPPRHILVYGPPKSGKSVAVGRLAEKLRLKIVDLEDSVKSLGNKEVFKPEWAENVEVFSIPDKQTYPMGIETLLKILKGTKTDICHLHGKVSCPNAKCKEPGNFSSIDLSSFGQDDVLVIESYSQVAESAMNYIMRDAIAKDNYDAKAGWDEYGKQGRILERIGSTLQVAPYNVVVTSHDMMVKLEDGTEKVVPIGGTSNASKVFAKYFDDVVYCEVVNKKHRLISSTTAKSNVLAGSRTGKVLGPDDTLLALFDL